MVTDWGAHHLDIAQWGLGMDQSGPVKVLPPETPGARRGAKLVYANGITVEHKDGFGVHFFGTNGEVQVNRGKFTFTHGKELVASYTGSEEDRKTTSCAAQVQKAERAFLKNAKIKLYASLNHVSDFMDCVKARRKPIANEEVGGRSVICCHLMNLAYYHGQKLDWNPSRLTFVGRSGDSSWLTRDYRGPWKV
jgi:predicted dehydrogenase